MIITTLKSLAASVLVTFLVACGTSSSIAPAGQYAAKASDTSNAHLTSQDYTGSNTSHPDDIWQRMRQDFELDVPNNAAVNSELAWFRSNSRHVEKVSEQAAPYLYYIVEAADKRDIPEEFALIPLLESAFNPFAGSTSGPHGLWQIVPGTARTLGLRQTAQYDERRDVEASTDAALDMLAKLNKQYNGDWLLTLAAYNRGPLAIDAAISRNRAQGLPTDFWSLPMPKHTVSYVARLMALAEVVSKPEQYGVNLAPIDNAPYFARVPLRQGIVLKDAAQLARVDESELRRLNPGVRTSSKNPLSASHLLVPADRADDFAAALQNYDFAKSERAAASEPALAAAPQLRSYKVRSGETWGKLARRYNVSAQSLAKLNKSTVDARLTPGQRVNLPALASQQSDSKRQKIAYRVKRGDSINTIAARFDVSVEDIQHWNANLSKQLKPGQQLTLWSEGQRKSAKSVN